MSHLNYWIQSLAWDLIQELIPPNLVPKHLFFDGPTIWYFLWLRPCKSPLHTTTVDEPFPGNRRRRRRRRFLRRPKLFLNGYADLGLKIPPLTSLTSKIVITTTTIDKLFLLLDHVIMILAAGCLVWWWWIIGRDLGFLCLNQAPIANPIRLCFRVLVATVPVLRPELANFAVEELSGKAIVSTHAALRTGGWTCLACCHLVPWS